MFSYPFIAYLIIYWDYNVWVYLLVCDILLFGIFYCGLGGCFYFILYLFTVKKDIGLSLVYGWCMVDVCFCVYVSVSSSAMSSQGPSSHHQAWHQMPLSAESSYRPKFFIYDLSHFKIGAFMKFTGKPLSSHLTSRRQCWGWRNIAENLDSLSQF